DNAAFAIVADELQTVATFDYESQDTCSVRILTDDGHGSLLELPFIIIVANVNDAPVITPNGPIGVIMSEDGLPIPWNPPALVAVDADEDALTWTIESQPAHGVVTLAGAESEPLGVLYAPTSNYHGSDVFALGVHDVGDSDVVT